jgi:hypothetical protein
MVSRREHHRADCACQADSVALLQITPAMNGGFGLGLGPGTFIIAAYRRRVDAMVAFDSKDHILASIACDLDGA